MKIPNLAYPVDVVLDTDAYNEIDDQFAIAYLLRSKPRLNTVALYAAPFSNALASTPGEGMEKSYHEILHLLTLCGETVDVFRGACTYLPDENTPAASPAALSSSMHVLFASMISRDLVTAITCSSTAGSLFSTLS